MTKKNISKVDRLAGYVAAATEVYQVLSDNLARTVLGRVLDADPRANIISLAALLHQIDVSGADAEKNNDK